MNNSLGTHSNVNSNLFNKNAKQSKINNNPFLMDKKVTNGKWDTGSNLIEQLKQKDSMNNAFLAAAIKCDPYAVWGITSQIRIA